MKYEIVVVDDGSTDSTRAVVETAASKSPVEIRYVWQANAGIGNARNHGVSEARGLWVAFLDDDEIASERWLDELTTAARISNADCVAGPCILRLLQPPAIEPVGTARRILGENPTMMFKAATSHWLERLRFRAARTATPGGGNALVRKALLEELGGFRPMKYGEDYEFFRRAQRHGARFAISHRAKIYHLLPPERLAPEYLYSYAKQGGATRAGLDGDESRARQCVMALLRLAHIPLITVPALIWYALSRQKSHLLSKRCSLYFAVAYIGAVLKGPDRFLL